MRTSYFLCAFQCCTKILFSSQDLKGQLARHPGLADGLADSITRWCSPPDKKTAGRRKEKAKFNLSNYWAVNRNFILFLALFLFTNAALAAQRLYFFSDFRNWDGSGPNVLVMVARACGICLNLNSMLLLVFVLRYTITFLRKVRA